MQINLPTVYFTRQRMVTGQLINDRTSETFNSPARHPNNINYLTTFSV